MRGRPKFFWDHLDAKNYAAYKSPSINDSELMSVVRNCNFAWVGDSLTDNSPGNGSVLPAYPDRVATILGFTESTGSNYKAQDGATLPDMISWMSIIDAFYDSTKPLNICFLWGGTNVINTYWTPIYLAQFCAALKALHNWKIVLTTFQPNDNTAIPPQNLHNQYRQVINDYLYANYMLMGGDWLMDIAADPHLGPDIAPMEGVYYRLTTDEDATDRVHMSDAGNQIVAQIAAQAVLDLVAISI